MSHPFRAWTRRAVLALLLTASAGPALAQDLGDDLRDYLSANGLLNRGLYELAATEYREFLSQHEEHAKAPIARYGLAVCLFRTEKFDEAIVELQQLHKRRRFEFAAEVGTILGQCYLAKQQPKPAADAFRRVVKRSADHDLADDAAAGLVEALHQSRDYEGAIEQCREFTKRWSDSPLRERVEFFWGLCEMARRDYRKAASRFSRILRKWAGGPFADQASLLLAQCHHHTDSLDEALKEYRKVLSRQGSRFVADALLGLGTLLHQRGKPKEAGAVLDQLIENFPQSPLILSTRQQRGRTLFDLGDYGRAFALFELVAGGDAGELSDDADYWMAKCKLRQEKFAEAAARLTMAIQKHAESELLPEMCYDRAVALVRGGDDLDQAAEALTDFRARFADHAMAPDALQLLAMTEHQRQNYDRSQTFCKEFLEEHRSHALSAGIRFLSAENDFLGGNYGPAIRGYKRFLAGDPNDTQAARANFRLGMALYRTDKFDQAEKLLAAIVRNDRENKLFRSARLALGDVYFHRGEWKQAEHQLGSYLEAGFSSPSADSALLKLGLARQRQGNYDGAVQAYDRLISEFAGSPQVLQARFERGQALVAMKKPADAAAEFKLVLSGGDERFMPFALNHLGAIALQRKDYDQAADYYGRTMDHDPPEQIAAEATYGRGQAHIAAGRFAEAGPDFRRVLDEYASHPRAAQARAQLAIALARQDRYADAVKVIDQVERTGGEGIDAALAASLQYEKAWCLKRLGKPSEAAEVYTNLLANSSAEDIAVHDTLELAEIHAAN
ncbi:MAG: tetratricopeptide repeat protein, partial [Planctomycetes bacterium]|nr:tetratricopeptide repeat protein [Planctomycetota bacterium]